MNSNSKVTEEKEVLASKKERGGLLPVTAKILNNASIRNEVIEYMGITISDIMFVGILISYEESDTRTFIKVWDQTGTIEIIFFNKNESEAHHGLVGFSPEKLKVPVRVFATAKVFKNKINVQGGKILNVNMNEFIYHKIDTANDWLYLTTETREDKENSGQFQSVNNLGNNLGLSNQKFMKKDRLLNKIREIARSNGDNFSRDLILSNSKDIGNEDEINRLINELANDGSLLESEDRMISLL